ncbi:MAG TPA: hypothetical protein VGE81_00720 [Candidatus Limnocylindrales bacterium]
MSVRDQVARWAGIGNNVALSLPEAVSLAGGLDVRVTDERLHVAHRFGELVPISRCRLSSFTGPPGHPGWAK